MHFSATLAITALAAVATALPHATRDAAPKSILDPENCGIMGRALVRAGLSKRKCCDTNCNDVLLTPDESDPIWDQQVQKREVDYPGTTIPILGDEEWDVNALTGPRVPVSLPREEMGVVAVDE